MKDTERRINEQELSDLEREIRKLGVPFSEPAPDPAFWAQFRVGVMERVERKHGLAAVREWIVQHALGSGLVGAAAAAVVVLALWGSPVSDQSSGSTAPIAQNAPAATPPAVATPPVITAPADVTPVAPSASATPSDKSIAAAAQGKPSRKSVGVKSVDPQSETEQLLAENSPVIEGAARPLLVSSESEYPVSLTELSDTELQSVYEGLLSLDSAQ